MSNTIVVCLLVLSGIGTSVRPLLAQSLADVAKKEEERRKTLPAPAKVYTNKDLGAVPPGPPPPAETPAAASEAAKSAGQDKTDKDSTGKGTADAGKPVKDEAYWSGRIKELRLQVDRDQGYADAMQTRLSALNTDFVNRDDPVQRAGIDRDRQRTQAELTRLTKAVQEGQKAVADLLEEARRAGVPPGWLR